MGTKIADDYGYIAARMQQLELEKEYNKYYDETGRLKDPTKIPPAKILAKPPANPPRRV